MDINDQNYTVIPPIGIGNLIPVENEPVYIRPTLLDVHEEDTRENELKRKYHRQEKIFKGHKINDKIIIFYFDIDDLIDPDSLLIELEIANPNKYNYLQLDNSVHSLIKSTTWIYKDKIIEHIQDYNVLLSLLNDINYKSNKYADNTDEFKNKREELQPLTYGTQEFLLHPRIYGTEFIFNNQVVQTSYLNKHDIIDGRIDMRPKYQNVFKIPIFSYIFCNGPEKKNKFLDLSKFKGLQLRIELNEFAFFVPCFNASINELVNVADKDDIAYESYYNFMSDYNAIQRIHANSDEIINKLNENADDRQIVNKYKLQMYTDNDMDIDDKKDVHDLNNIDINMDDLGLESAFLKIKHCIQNMKLFYIDLPMDQFLVLEFIKCLSFNNNNNINDWIMDSRFNHINVFGRFFNNLYFIAKDKINNLSQDLKKFEFEFKMLKKKKNIDDECYKSLINDSARNFFIFLKSVDKIELNIDRFFIIPLDWISLDNVFDQTINDKSKEKIDDFYQLLKLNHQEVDKEFLMNYTEDDLNIDLANNINDLNINFNALDADVFYQKKLYYFYFDLINLRLFISGSRYKSAENDNIILYDVTYNSKLKIIFGNGNSIIAQVSNNEIQFDDYNDFIEEAIAASKSKKKNIVVEILNSLNSKKNFISIAPLICCLLTEDLSNSAIIKLLEIVIWSLNSMIKCGNVKDITKELISNLIRLKYKFENYNFFKKKKQSKNEYNKLNMVNGKYNLIISREYDLISYYCSFHSYTNKDGSKIKYNENWSGSSTYYHLTEIREFVTYPPSKVLFSLPNNNVKNIYQIILSDAYKKYPTCRLTSRYNRKIKNYFIETEYGVYPKLLNKFDNTSFSENNFLFENNKKSFDTENSSINIYNSAMDNNTQMYITKKLNNNNSQLFLFSEYANYFDEFLFGYFTEINSKCVLNFNINDIKKTLEIGNKLLNEFYICIESDIVYEPEFKDEFSNYQIYTFCESKINYNYINGNIQL